MVFEDDCVDVAMSVDAPTVAKVPAPGAVASAPGGAHAVARGGGDVAMGAGGERLGGGVGGRWRAGERVSAFYSLWDDPRGYRCVRLRQPFGRPSPLAGLSEGWLPAEVMEDFDPAGSGAAGGVSLRFEGRFADPMDAKVSLAGAHGTFRTPPSLVRKEAPREPPALSVLVVRWFDYWSFTGYSDFDIRREGSVKDFFTGDRFSGEEAVAAALAGDYEVITVFVRRTEDLARISEAWAREEMRGRHVGAMYFLWPVQKVQAEQVQPAFVCERALFGLMQRMELAGVPTRYPHPGHLYRLLAGKLWVPQMSLAGALYGVPPTVRLHFQRFSTDPDAAAAEALEALGAVAALGGGSSSPWKGKQRGVAKLGFSWCGSDVEAFEGAAQLREKAQHLFEKPNSESQSLLVQAMVPHVVCELRCLVLFDRASGVHLRCLVYMCEDEGRPNDVTSGFSLTTHLTMSKERALEVCFRGDGEAQEKAHAEVERLTTMWLAWLRSECSEPQPQNRLDFLVACDPAKRGAAAVAVHICEVTEGGSSLCGLRTDTRTCAYLNQFFADRCCGLPACRCCCPRPLPPLASKYGEF